MWHSRNLLFFLLFVVSPFVQTLQDMAFPMHLFVVGAAMVLFRWRTLPHTPASVLHDGRSWGHRFVMVGCSGRSPATFFVPDTWPRGEVDDPTGVKWTASGFELAVAQVFGGIPLGQLLAVWVAHLCWSIVVFGVFFVSGDVVSRTWARFVTLPVVAAQVAVAGLLAFGIVIVVRTINTWSSPKLVSLSGRTLVVGDRRMTIDSNTALNLESGKLWIGGPALLLAGRDGDLRFIHAALQALAASPSGGVHAVPDALAHLRNTGEAAMSSRVEGSR